MGVTRWQGRIPLLVGVTGHRDLDPADLAKLGLELKALFVELKAALPSTPIVAVSQLAEGADQLVTIAALESDCESACVLPLALDAYCERFRTPAALAEFKRLFALSVVIELPEVRDVGGDRASGYAAAGHFIARHAAILLAIWDGVPAARPGSSADVVRVRRASWLGGPGPAVYHVPVRRARSGDDAPGSPYPVRPLPTAAAIVEATAARRIDEFNAVAPAALRKTAIEVPAPFSELDDPRIADTASTFAAAKTIAVDCQRALNRRKGLLHATTFLAAVAFVTIFKTGGHRWLVVTYLALLATALVLRHSMRVQGLHRRHLDCRYLAEGLRVVLFWRIAGIYGDRGVRSAAFRLTSRHDRSLRWLGIALASLEGWVGRVPLPIDGIAFAVQHWLGSAATPEPSAQIPYYRFAAAGRRRAALRLDRLVNATLALGIATAALLAILPDHLDGRVGAVLMAVMGILPLISGTASGLLDVPAELEVAREYDAAAELLEHADRLLAQTTTDSERRILLADVGAAALAEHRIWHTVFRERAPEDGRPG